jgi:hypothetical protein
MNDHQQTTRDEHTPPKTPRRDDDKAAQAVEDEKADHQEELLDEGIEESFPASDPVSVKRIT